jgi:hypothetical protein
MFVALRCRILININDEYIEYAEKLFLRDGQCFDEERREIIRCNETVDVHACPGSGKTTVLLAKLAIIEKQLPLVDNKGICVLTHTNVAIDEVRERMGKRCNELFQYPNYFGTIQGFVNKFLTIPFYEKVFNSRLNCIDDSIYNDEVIKEYFKINFNLRRGFELKFKGQNIIEIAKSIRLNMITNEIALDIIGESLYKSENPTLEALKKMKFNMLRKGILCYDDAYYLANKYTEKYKMYLRQFFSARFAYVFIDEVQDTGTHQSIILSNIFNSSEIVVQKFGDPNQSIYEGRIIEVGGNDSVSVASPIRTLRITNSKRFSPSISKVISPFELIESGMNGNSEIAEIKPKIIIYNVENIDKVVNQFGKIIIENNLHKLDRKVFKAVGWVGKENTSGKITIASYFNEFNKIQNNDVNHNNLMYYLCKSNHEQNPMIDVYNVHENLIDAILRILYMESIKDENSRYYTKTTFYNKIRQVVGMESEFRRGLSLLILKLRNNQNIAEELKTFIYELLKEVFGLNEFGEETKSFLQICEETTEENILHKSSNNYIYTTGDDEVSIEFATVHSVKGETHTATLYLETFYRTLDIKRMIQYFIGKKQNKPNDILKRNMKVAYVGMSRPSHLLCIAATKESVNGYESLLEEAGWEVIYI